MPCVGLRQKLSADLVKASTKVFSVIYLTSKPPSYVSSYAYLQLEMMATAAAILLDDSEEVLIFSLLSLSHAFNTFLKATCNLQEIANTQHAILHHTMKIGLVIGQAFDNITHLRYIEPRVHIRDQALQRSRFSGIFKASERNFRKFARMSKNNFNQLVTLIKDDLVFHNNSLVPQSPVEWQLLLTLCQLGLSGNGGSAYMIGQMFAMSEGSVHNFTRRCFEAILKLKDDYVHWPDQEEQNHIKWQIGRKSFFKDCVGFIDGTLIPLSRAPKINPEDFWTRKHTYALNSLLICDHQARIIYSFHGYCGSSHDQRIFSHTEISQHPEDFFGENEYILADSGYTCTKNLIPTFKSP